MFYPVFEYTPELLGLLVEIGVFRGTAKQGVMADCDAGCFRSGASDVLAADGALIYGAPDAKDVPILMKDLLDWIQVGFDEKLPAPILAAVVHYQIETIRPYVSGNTDLAHSFSSSLLVVGGFKFVGCLVDATYYDAINVTDSVYYYVGRETADITDWIVFYLQAVIRSQGVGPTKEQVRQLDGRQRKVLRLFKTHAQVTASQVSKLLGIKSRTARHLLQSWAVGDDSFVVVKQAGNKNRTYALRS